jgi:hypothetical protein
MAQLAHARVEVAGSTGKDELAAGKSHKKQEGTWKEVNAMMLTIKASDFNS